MGNFWSRAFGRTETRFGENWHALTTHNGIPAWRSTYSSAQNEEVSDDFIGHVDSAYKANGVVYACSVARMMVFSEARFVFQEVRDGRPGELVDDKSLDLLRNPWPNCTTAELLSRAIQDVDMCGNHYLLKEGSGADLRLRRLRPDWVSIVLNKPPDQAVKSDVIGYIYRPGGTTEKSRWEYYAVEEEILAHWSPIPDPGANFRGMSPLTPIMREVIQDQYATTHKIKFFQNAATPNLAVSFKETITAEQFREFMEMMDESKAGIEHAYETLYLGGGADVTVVGADMQQMNFKTLQGLSETRIAAAFRVHPAIVGLSEGLQGSSLNAGNFGAAKNLFVTGTLMPLWRSLCTAYSVLVPELDGKRLWFDTRDIAFLRQDQKEIADIMDIHAQVISKLVMQGYTPESSVKYIQTEDISVLEHTGLYSVQLQPPGTVGKGYQPGQDQSPSGDKDGDGKPDDAQKPDASKTSKDAGNQQQPKVTKPPKPTNGGAT